jgi:hypothetical protein
MSSNNSNDTNDKSTYSFKTLNSESANIINEMSSNYSSLPSKVKHRMHLNTKHLKDYSSKDETQILNHLKKCEECKSELLYILMARQNNNNNNNINNNTNNSNSTIINDDIIKKNNNSDKSNSIIDFNIGNNEIKHLFILVVIGIFIIIIIDSFMNK